MWYDGDGTTSYRLDVPTSSLGWPCMSQEENTWRDGLLAWNHNFNVSNPT
jgi:hypothetical protein